MFLLRPANHICVAWVRLSVRIKYELRVHKCGGHHSPAGLHCCVRLVDMPHADGPQRVIGSRRSTVEASTASLVEVLDVAEKIARHNAFKGFSAMSHPRLPVCLANDTCEMKRP